MRNLTAGEIVAQVHAVNREVASATRALGRCRPLTNLVFMGMGEPLHNFENLKAALAHPPVRGRAPTSRTATSPSPRWGWCR